jgi:hypothetical protein
VNEVQIVFWEALMQDPTSHADESPALKDLLDGSDIPAEPFEVMEDIHQEKPKRKRKHRFYFSNIRLYAGVAAVATVTTLIVAGIVLLVVTPSIRLASATATFPYPTPVPYYNTGYWNWNDPLLTTDYVGAITPNSLVYITNMTYDPNQGAWHYTVKDGNNTLGEAWEWQIIPPPSPTPTVFPFSQAIGMGYLLMTTEPVGTIPADARVRIISATVDNNGEWLYSIEAKNDGSTGDARAYQLAYALDVTPRVTPTSPYFAPGSAGENNAITLVQIGSIPTNTHVSIGSGWFDGTEWMYSISTQDGQYADNVPGSQLTLDTSPGPTPAPTLTPSPTLTS